MLSLCPHGQNLASSHSHVTILPKTQHPQLKKIQKIFSQKNSPDLLHFPHFDHYPMHDDDVDPFLLRIRAGDEQAIEELYLQCRQGFCQSLGRKWRLNAEQTLELYQDSFLALLESIQKGKIQEVRQGWLPLLKGIGNNLQRVAGRRNTRWQKVATEEALGVEPTSDETTEQETLLNILQVELERMEEKCRNLIDLRVLKEMSFKSIYDWLNPSSTQLEDEKDLAAAVGGIRVQYGRCIDRLRKKVSERIKNPRLWN